MLLEQDSSKQRINNIVIKPLTPMNSQGSVQETVDNQMVKSCSSDRKESKWKIVKHSNRRMLPRHSQGEIKLNNLIQELQKFSSEEKHHKTEHFSMPNSFNWVKISRQRLAYYLSLPTFHYSIIVLVILDLIVVLVDLVLAQLSAPCLTDDEMAEYNTTKQRDSCLLPYSVSLTLGDLFLFYFSLILLIIFVFEIFISLYAFGWRHYTNLLYLLDSLIVFSSFIMELYFHFGNIGRAGRAAAAIVVLRLWKIVRAIHAVVHSITLKNRLIIKKIQEAQIIIQQEKEFAEQMLEKQNIKVEYLIDRLKTLDKLPNSKQINIYVDKIWQQRMIQSNRFHSESN